MSSSLDDWKHWRDDRVVAARAPHGPLALTGTHWLADLRGGVPDVPGRWERQGDCVVLTAARHDGLEVDGVALDGPVRLCPDTAPKPSLITHGGRLLVLILREGEYAVRIYDPASHARAVFAGIDAHPFDERWTLPARFTPYPGPRTVTVPNADGRERGLALAGTVAFTLPSNGDAGAAAGTAAAAGAAASAASAAEERTLQVSQAADGSLSAVFADASSGRESFRFRFISLPAPGLDGATVLDLNRAYLPPCAFADHFICPFPPPGNRLDATVPAGETRILQH
ncbi:DUF1684 domain-containing protein [Streptacidiphilus sp. P02-A3a]|uniref:DUF1684 domain-containing protein n=1 Tax=Streptacidiphilus sp. P02-A3a TaxID=2704468 RepID=UPI001CDBC009|nr:DUF1684 domain-containing protein [Streptacidiphilus sp. P02-A3a]